MKISAIILTVMFVGLIFLVANIMIDDFKTGYDLEIEDDFTEDYDYSQDVEKRVDPLKTRLENIDEETTGWKLFGAGLVAIPFVIISFIGVIFSTVGILLTMIGDFAGVLNIDGRVLLIVSAMIMVWFIFKLIGWWQKQDT